MSPFLWLGCQFPWRRLSIRGMNNNYVCSTNRTRRLLEKKFYFGTFVDSITGIRVPVVDMYLYYLNTPNGEKREKNEQYRKLIMYRSWNSFLIRKFVDIFFAASLWWSQLQCLHPFFFFTWFYAILFSPIRKFNIAVARINLRFAFSKENLGRERSGGRAMRDVLE